MNRIRFTRVLEGCRENIDPFIHHPPPWSAKRISDYGFSLMQVHNRTHMHFQQVAASSETVEDDFWVVKNHHGPMKREHKRKLARHGTYIPENYCHHPTHCNRYETLQSL